MNRAFPTLITTDVHKSADFYRQLFELVPTFESDWFISLASATEPTVELAFISADSDVASGPAGAGAGVCLTFVVEDAEIAVARAVELGAEVIQPPQNLFYGQRRALLKDPDGRVIDVSSECPPDPEWMKQVEANPAGGYREV